MTRKGTAHDNSSSSSIQKAKNLSLHGKDRQALETVQTHLRKFPRDLEALNLAGTLAARTGDWPLAEISFVGALNLNGNNTYALYNLAKVLEQSGREGGSIELLTHLIQIEPRNVNALNQIGTLLVNQGYLGPGLKALEAVIEIDPSFEMAYRNLYITLYKGSHYEEAGHIAKRAIKHITSDFRWKIRTDLILCLWQSQALDEAREVAEELIRELERADNPTFQETYFQALTNYGVVLLELGEPDAAEIQFRKVIALAPSRIDPYINMARLNGYRENFQDAIGWFDKALTIDPENANLHTHFAHFLGENANRPDLALPHHLSALAQSPGNAELQYYLGATQLALGQLKSAYRTWECRWARREGGSKSNLPIPEWTGTPERGGSLLVYREQGIGDEIIFASCLPDIVNRFERIVCFCHSKLKPLFTRSFPRVEFRSGGTEVTNEEVGGFDWQIAIGSLPPIVRPDIESFPNNPQFLIAAPEKVEHFRQRLASQRQVLTIGIGWRSGLLALHRKALYPYLEFWQALFDIPGVTWVNLQYGEVSEELSQAEAKFGISIIDFKDVDHFQDLDSSAALMKACDLVIGPGTSTTMISAAVGVPTIRIAPGGDKYQLGTAYYPWLPSLTPIQRRLGEPWTVPIEQTASIVRALIAEQDAQPKKNNNLG